MPFRYLIFILILFTGNKPVLAQLPAKQVKHQMQTWTSINTVFRLTPKWGVVGDLHLRRNHGISEQGFYFIRLGAMYWINDHTTLAGGIGHLWLAPKEGLQTWGDEQRLYQQFQVNGKPGKLSFLHRIRNEQRWQRVIRNDVATGQSRFSNRLRYLAGLQLRIFSNPKMPTLQISDELMIQFGKEVVYNTFDQNRFFVGIRQGIGPQFSFDFGYMNVYQQRATGYQYDMNHTLRLFFYYNGKLRHKT